MMTKEMRRLSTTKWLGIMIAGLLTVVVFLLYVGIAIQRINQY